jgi:tRNA-binding protein
MEPISWTDFAKIDIRVGTIVEVRDFPKAKKAAYQLTIDFGPLGVMKSSAQITRPYAKDQLTGKQVVAVLNFPAKQIADFVSQCLVLGIYSEESEVILLQPERKVANGLKIG